MGESRSLELTLESKTDSIDAVELIGQVLARQSGHDEDAVDHLGMAVRIHGQRSHAWEWLQPE